MKQKIELRDNEKGKGGDVATLINAKTNALLSAPPRGFKQGFKHCGCERALRAFTRDGVLRMVGNSPCWERVELSRELHPTATRLPAAGRRTEGYGLREALRCQRLHEGLPTDTAL